MSNIIRVIVVDDSAFMRKSLSMLLESDPEIRVIATARDGREGVDKIRELKPDIVTMDIEMPVMNGLEALAVVMKEMPVPVLMVSSLTTEGAQATIDALSLGAVDFISKELSYVSLDIVKIKADLIAKVKDIVHSRSLHFRLQRIRASSQHIKAPAGGRPPVSRLQLAPPKRRDFRAVVLGISTGGPFALLETIPKLPANFPIGIAIVQHMPPRFTKSLAERLDGLSNVQVKEAADGDAIEPGLVLIAPGGLHMTFGRSGSSVRVRISEEPKNTLYHPSADIMMTSAAENISGPILGVIMTGMGKDGLEGLKLIRKKEGYIIAQDEESCVVYGMPRAAVDEGVANAVVPLRDMPDTIVRIVGGGD
ncbi:MAG TPA: chemotaxis response regulator protein-glutamate methylesterase [Bacteroidota bacterium]|nr:chemotaxis response regulator protein-glutamate methylesterase [Bacteroidota bacterium]